MTAFPAASDRSYGWRRRAVAGWVRRRPLVAGLVALVVVTVSVRLVWGWHLSRQLAIETAALRRAGHPTTVGEIVIDPVPDAQNAWPTFVRAAAAMKPGVDSPGNSVLEYPSYPPYGDAWEKLAAASESAHVQTFGLARKARSAPRAQLRQEVPDIPTIFSSVGYNKSRALANVLTDGATFAHLRGDDAEAVERIRDVLHLSRSLRQDSFLISQLVGIGIDALALAAAQPIAPALRVDGADSSGRAATRQQVHELIAELLDERDARAWFTRSFHFERAFVLDGLKEQAAETWAIRPLADRLQLRWLDGFETLISAGNEPDHAAVERAVAGLDVGWQQGPAFMLFTQPPKPKVLRYSRWFEDGGPGSMVGAITQYYRVSAQRRVVAVAFAARLYQIDHGRWPDKLADLVPAYLPAVPTDPFGEGDRPLGYVVQRGVLPDGGDRPLVYFDAGGNEAIIDPEPMIGWQNEPRINKRFPTRQYRDISLWVPTTRRFDEEQRSAAEAVDDDPQEPDAPGDDEEDDAQPKQPAEE